MIYIYIRLLKKFISIDLLNQNKMNFHNVKRFHCTLIISYFILKIYLIKLIEVLI